MQILMYVGINMILTLSLNLVNGYMGEFSVGEQKSVNYIVPGLIAVILMMLSTLLTALTVVRERERGTIGQLIVSPLRSHELMLGKLAPYVLIAFFDVLLVMGAGRVLFGVAIRGSIPLLLLLAAVYLMAALGTGRALSEANFWSPALSRAVTAALAASPPDALVVYCSAMMQYVPPAWGRRAVGDLVDVESAKWAQYHADIDLLAPGSARDGRHVTATRRSWERYLASAFASSP